MIVSATPPSKAETRHLFQDAINSIQIAEKSRRESWTENLHIASQDLLTARDAFVLMFPQDKEIRSGLGKLVSNLAMIGGWAGTAGLDHNFGEVEAAKTVRIVTRNAVETANLAINYINENANKA